MSFEDPPRKPTGLSIGEPLDLLSVAELEQRIHVLDEEIARVQAMIDMKRASKSAANAFFRS